MARDRKFSTDELFQLTHQLLLTYGYEGFTFSILAEQLEVSRGTLYKYYENKDELITEFMLYEMSQFMLKLKDIHAQEGFEAQTEYLIDLIFKQTTIPELIEIGRHIPNTNEKVEKNKKQLDEQRMDMYYQLESYIQLGRREQRLKKNLPTSLILGLIFQTITIPNHFNVPRSEWIEGIKEIICHGMFLQN
ncbi:TetR/AcrR family transcriptional regulator [Mesobacillus maritimus]|uniref:TetR/AcrR family transcriptional regulator n=1 Tax=Mesobacillus maritimus TaxID=1643336 RepID=UPI002041BCAF|nr:TetR/AcrR family transcriptional regulator [Mesobacillus maritimus]MCM3585841.1 TetR/AcrR family transcriptional regulator [Mesobacillus maritimus]